MVWRTSLRSPATVSGMETVSASSAPGTGSVTDVKLLAAQLFNETWRLLELQGRSEHDDDRMIHAAHASRFHWGEVGTAVNRAIGEWQVSHVYSVLGRPEPATYHAVRSLATCKENGIEDFPLAFAYEAFARADAVAGRKGDLRRHLALARDVGSRIKDKEDRDLLFRDLKSIRPGLRR